MLNYLAFLFLTISTTVLNQGEGKNLLDGKHLRCIPRMFPTTITFIKNETGHVIGNEGPQIELLKALSEMYHFSYEYMYVDSPRLEDLPKSRGALSYLIRNEADFILTPAVGTASRLEVVDFPASFQEASFSVIVSYPRKKHDITASLKPFPYEAWILIIVTSSSTLLCIHLFDGNSQSDFCRRTSKNIQRKMRKNSKKKKTWGFNFVMGNLVSQGQSCQSPALTVRIVAGAWCVGCFFLVQIYCSTLTSYLTSPNQKPIADTVQELANYPGLKLTVDTGLASELLLLNANYGSYKKLGDNLRNNPKSRCNKTDECLTMVLADDLTAYGASKLDLHLIVQKDFKATATCHFYIVKEALFTSSLFTLLQKKSPYTETISRGILRITQAGLYDEWISRFIPPPEDCLGIDRKNKKLNLKISLGHISSAFAIFMIGIIVSILVLLAEVIVKLHA